MALILGIDPGSRLTGFGVINAVGASLEYVTSGCLRLPDVPLPERLKLIFEGIDEIVARHQPQHVAVEQVFMARNAASALKLGQARGAAIVAAASRNLSVAEYSARQIKQAVVGTGSADKQQVQQMVTLLLKLPGTPQEDAADALAAAICHAHTQQSLIRMAGARSTRGGRAR